MQNIKIAREHYFLRINVPLIGLILPFFRRLLIWVKNTTRMRLLLHNVHAVKFTFGLYLFIDQA